QTTNLLYPSQSPSLNQTFSHLFAYFLHHQHFLIGQHVYTPGLAPRPLTTISNPHPFPQPSHMNHFLYTNSHNPRLHTNSPIPNKPPYNTIPTIPKQRSEQIYYTA
ncbi:M4 family metallopeptidase, partial [Staphylococcus epidermidis]|uniref:M4 family metallopeptidase n=1 Tax=Staphylococcus epidermidis TaxID=1282 RepID=UPI001642F3C1